MDIDLEPGTYVVAVSGGVDSMVLLDILHGLNDINLVIAHYDHGIRHDSDLDRKLVQETAIRHRLPFVYDEGNLGDVSEATARKARYDFLYRVRQAAGARAIITAHHQDDLLETAVLNLLRGTGRKGLTSLGSTDIIKRPLLEIPKKHLIEHARKKGIKWREDSTNTDTRYRRNHVRSNVLSKFSEADRDQLLTIIKSLQVTNQQIDRHITNHLYVQPALDRLDRHQFIMLPHAVAREVMLAWLRRHQVEDISSRTLERLVTASKTFSIGQETDVDKHHKLKVKHKLLALMTTDR